MNRHIVDLGPRMEIPFAVCIPSRGRPDVLAKTLKKMPFLDSSDTFIGFETREGSAYIPVLKGTSIYRVGYDNPTGSVAVAREEIRREVVRHASSYRYVVVTDDNAHYTREALHNLVATAATVPGFRMASPVTGEEVQSWAIVAGMHSTAAHFDRHRIADSTETHSGYRSYQHFGMIFQCYPMSLYKHYSYPADAYGLDDRHLMLWAINRGLPADAIRIAMDAPFTKQRYQGSGGQGTPQERAMKCGLAVARLAHDFPLFVGATGTLPIKWRTAFALRDGMKLDRLAGGAMRKEDALVTKVTIKRRIRKPTHD